MAINATKYRVKLKYNNTLIWQSGQVAPDQGRSIAVVDVATFRLPPWLQDSNYFKSVDLVLTGEQSTGVDVDLHVDYAFLMPLDGWRYITAVGYGTAYLERVVDNGIEDQLYIDDGAIGYEKIGILTGYGKPICVEPGKTQRLYFLQHDNVLYDYIPARAASVKIYYRPRRKVL